MGSKSMMSNSIQPDVYSYTTVIQAYAAPESSRHTPRYSKNNESNNNSSDDDGDDMSPSNGAEMALQLLQEMLEQEQNDNDDNIKSGMGQATQLKPNAYTYTAVILALCNNRQINKAYKL